MKGVKERRGNNQNWEESKNRGRDCGIGKRGERGRKLEKIEMLKTKTERIGCVSLDS